MKPANDEVRLRLKQPLLPILTIICLVLHVLDVTVIWQSLFFIFGGLWLIGWLWAISLASGLEIRRLVRFSWAQVGDHLEERFELENHGWAPALWLAVEDGSNLPGHAPGWVTGVNGYSKSDWRLSAVCERRGLYQLGPLVVKTGDPFGIYEVKKFYSTSQTLLVTPPVVSLPGIQVAQGGHAGDGQVHPHARERSVSVAGVRGYAPGDNLHLIHWPTSVRKQELFVRLFDTTQTGDWRIFLDLNRDTQAGTKPADTVEHGIILAASLVGLALVSHFPVGLVVNGDDLTWLPPKYGEDQRWEIMKALALAQPGEFCLKEVLERLNDRMRDRGSLILISTDTSMDWLPSLLKLSWRGIIPTILLIDGAEYTAKDQVFLLPKVTTASELLASQGVYHHIIPKRLMMPQTSPGSEGTWEWKASPQGRAVAVREPKDLSWRKVD
jgi:uncharacterized protein (DUF58 family)